MAQLNDSIVRGILEGSGVTRWEVEQLCHRWLQTSTTTPQPSADAVRELVRRWRAKAKHHEIKGDRADVSADTSEWHKGMDEGVSDCADQLESLVTAASGEKGVG